MRLIRHLASLASAIALALLTALPAAAKPPLEAFGDQPTTRAMELSPDGNHLAFIQTLSGKEMLVLVDLVSGKRTNLIDASNIKARAINFIGADYLLLHGSKSLNAGRMRETVEMGGAFSVNIKTGKAKQLLPPVSTGVLQGGVGDVLAVDPDGRHIYIDAYIQDSPTDVSFDLMKIDMETGEPVGPGYKGSVSTSGWLSDSNGKPVARFDIGSVSQMREIFGYADGKSPHVILTSKDVLSELAVIGKKEGSDAIFVVDRPENEQFMGLYELSLANGQMKLMMKRPDADVEGAIIDRNGFVRGIVYGGFRPRYQFFDATLNKDVEYVQKLLPDQAIHLVSWSDDWKKLIFMVEGGNAPSQYLLGNRTTGDIRPFVQMRPEITDTDIGEVQVIHYAARDKLSIPALVTFPAGVSQADRKKLPLVVLPHGGPEAYDRIEFDWLSQYFANEGYMVLQPQFRGSDGFGVSFRSLGLKQWGRGMQNDVSDGVAEMVAKGWADPTRICIVGWSYGGYAALAGATLTPELYKCVVSVAGVSDLPAMLGWERRGGNNSPSYVYWKSRIGDPATELDDIKAVSPAQQAANVRVPVLLIHGQQDSVVPPEQSSTMERTLKGLGKDVKLVRIPGDDHSLTTSENRRAALKEIGAFLNKHLGPGAPRSPVAPAAPAKLPTP